LKQFFFEAKHFTRLKVQPAIRYFRFWYLLFNLIGQKTETLLSGLKLPISQARKSYSKKHLNHIFNIFKTTFFKNNVIIQ